MRRIVLLALATALVAGCSTGHHELELRDGLLGRRRVGDELPVHEPDPHRAHRTRLRSRGVRRGQCGVRQEQCGVRQEPKETRPAGGNPARRGCLYL